MDARLENQTLIVAEIGNMHEGRFEVAQEMVHRAAEAGVDAVKFQTFKTELFISPSNPRRFAQLKGFELTFAQFAELAVLARSLGLLFISTPLDLESTAFLEGIVDYYKIASSDNTFYPLLRQVAQTGKPVIISAGLVGLDEIKRTVGFMRREWAARAITGELAVLHCVTSYPVPPEQANMRAVAFLAEHLDCPVGYSDHTLGIDAPLLAVALGARIVEKHFTLDKNYSDFRDHQLAADPAEMKTLVEKIRLAETLLGDYSKAIQPGEQALLEAVRRSIVAARALPEGHQIAPDDLIWTRPGGGLAPGEEGRLVGRQLQRAVAPGEMISETDVV